MYAQPYQEHEPYRERRLQHQGQDNRQHQPTQQEPHIRTPSIELPMFTGINASAWLQECESIFDLAGIAQENKVKWANAHIRGKAKTWLNSCNFDLTVMNW
jgi:hypothetical protein